MDKKKKKIVVILIVTAIILISLGVYISMSQDHIYNTVLEEQEEVYGLIREIDFTLLDAVPYTNSYSKKISDSDIIHTVTMHIIKNQKEFKGKIKRIDDSPLVNEKGEKYTIKDYIDKDTFQTVVYKYFGIDNLDYSKQKYYCKELDSIILIPRGVDSPSRGEPSLIGVSQISKDGFVLQINYERTDRQNEAYYIVDYELKRYKGKDGKYKVGITGFKKESIDIKKVRSSYD